jgi:dethiobiotin synthetase
MLTRLPIPGLFITGTDTDVGKTLVAGAIAQYLHRAGLRVAVSKPTATGCVHRREGLVSEDAEFLAHCADARHPLDLICPQRFAEPLAPAVAAQRAGVAIDWQAIDRSIQLMSKDSDVMIIEGVGGILVPIDQKHTVLDLATWLAAPSVVVARPGLGTINHTCLTLMALRSGQLKVAGIVVNRYPTDTPGLAQETNLQSLEKWGRAPLLSIVPEAIIPKNLANQPIPPAVADAIKIVDWAGLAGIG